MDRKKLKKARKSIDKVDMKIFNLIKKRTKIVTHMLSLKKQKNQIIDKKRINHILKRIKSLSKRYKVSPSTVERIWRLMIQNFIILEKKLFKKPKK